VVILYQTLSQCASVPVCQCSSVPVFQCSSVPVFQCSSVPVYQSTSLQVYASIQAYKYQCTSVFLGVVSPSESCLHTPKSMHISFYLAYSISTALVVLSNFVHDVKTNKSIQNMLGLSCHPRTLSTRG
jgi:hypothetical protein